MPSLPAISGVQLIKLLKKDGWEIHKRSTHGMTLKKLINGRIRVTTIPTKRNRSLPKGTLGAILGKLQTGLGHDGLFALIKEFGLH